MGTVTSSDQIHFNLMLLVTLDSGLVPIFLLFNHTLLTQGKSIGGVQQPHASLLGFLVLGQTCSVNISFKLQHRSRRTKVSVNL